MDNLRKTRWISLLTVAAAIAGSAAGAAAQTPVPKVTGPIAVTTASYPFLAADRNLQPVDLKKLGYVEEEFIVTGAANVYDWNADGSVAVKTPNVPYGTRILTRRPADPARFSGNVVVEMLNTVRRVDWAWMWGYTQVSLVERGDAWVGITLPAGAGGLKTFNAGRYAAVTFANPSSAPCAGARGGAAADEEGLRWDMISQVGALLKSNVAARPLAGLRVEAIYLTTGQSPDLMTYISAIHARAAVYDGYLIKQPAAPSRINQCATAPARGDARQAIKSVNVPVVAVVAQGEVIAGLPFRRADSDDPGSRFRLYEIAGASHIDWAAYTALPSFPDQTAAGIMPQGDPTWPISGRCEPDIRLDELPLMTHVFDAAFANLEQWVRKGTAPPRAPRIQLNDETAATASIATDASGNGIGGVRSPYVDVPTATWLTTSPGPGNCREFGHKVAFDAARVQALYASDKIYTDKVAQSVDALVKERWLTASASRRIKQELAKR